MKSKAQAEGLDLHTGIFEEREENMCTGDIGKSCK